MSFPKRKSYIQKYNILKEFSRIKENRESDVKIIVPAISFVIVYKVKSICPVLLYIVHIVLYCA